MTRRLCGRVCVGQEPCQSAETSEDQAALGDDAAVDMTPRQEDVRAPVWGEKNMDASVVVLLLAAVYIRDACDGCFPSQKSAT